MTDGLVLHVERSGRPGGRPLVLINSLGTDLRLWDGVLPALAERWSVVRHDKRGHGLSDLAPGIYTIAELARDLAGLLDRLAVRGAFVVGVSIGGMIAQALAAARPDLVGGLVLMSATHKVGQPALWDQRMAAIRAGGIAGMADAILERWFTADYRSDHPAELAIWRNMLTRTPVEGYLGCCAAIRDADLTEGTRRIAVPTLCIAGAHDLGTPPAVVEELAGLIAGARFMVVPDAGHLPFIEQPALVTEAVLAFAREHGLG
ncbi:MAG: 3-oxoadipate enol-lactonase [Geminicoccaceae bacterium]